MRRWWCVGVRERKSVWCVGAGVCVCLCVCGVYEVPWDCSGCWGGSGRPLGRRETKRLDLRRLRAEPEGRAGQWGISLKDCVDKESRSVGL